jgi:IS30 family transposase
LFAGQFQLRAVSYQRRASGAIRADPYCAWQRGANENTNGLLRRYFPKGTDFSQVADHQLAFVVHALNNRPRKCLGYRKPFEVVQHALRGALRS